MEEWDGQSPPTARTQKGKPVVNLQSVIGAEKSLPNFGPYARERAALKAEMKKSQDILDDVPAPNRQYNTIQYNTGRQYNTTQYNTGRPANRPP